MVFLEFFLAVLCVIAAVGLPILFANCMVKGLIAMRRSSEAGGSFPAGLAGMMTEIDRMTRPSVQYMEQLSEKILEGDEIGGD